MKKSLYSLMCILMCITTYAQDHFSVKGIEINGAEDTVLKQFISIGFTSCTPPKDFGENSKLLSGSFSAFSGEKCYLRALTTPISNTVYAIDLFKANRYTNNLDVWNELRRIAAIYEEKYGAPSEYGKFDYNGRIVDGLSDQCERFVNNMNLVATHCRVRIWKTTNGTIGLRNLYGYVCIEYLDDANFKIKEDEIKQLEIIEQQKLENERIKKEEERKAAIEKAGKDI